MTARPTLPIRLLALLLAACASASLADTKTHVEAPTPAEARVEVILAKFREAQANTSTLQARFRQVKVDDLLAEPLVQSGAFYYRKPTDFRWEYEKPENVIVLATADRVRRYSPESKTLRDTALSKNRKRMYNYFGISSNIDALRKHFHIAVNAADTEHPEADKLELTGKARRVQKRIRVLEMWIDRRISLPSAMRVVMADGSSTTWEFTDMKVNPSFANSLYDLTLPPGTKVVADETAGAGGAPVMDEITQEPAPSGTPAPARP